MPTSAWLNAAARVAMMVLSGAVLLAASGCGNSELGSIKVPAELKHQEGRPERSSDRLEEKASPSSGPNGSPAPRTRTVLRRVDRLCGPGPLQSRARQAMTPLTTSP